MQGTKDDVHVEGEAPAAEALVGEASQQEERELGTKPVGRLFVKYSAVSLAGTIAQVVMVILEGMIMGFGLGEHGLACVSVILSIELLNLATGGALGIGVSARIGARLGAGDHEGAQRAFGQGFWFSLYVACGLALVLELFAPQLVWLLGATPDIYDDSLLGIRCFVAFFPFTIMGQLCASVLRVDERPHAAARFQIVSSGVAICYLAFTVLVLGLGVNAVGIYFGLTIALWSLGYRYFLPGGKSSLRIRRCDMRPSGALMKSVLVTGLPFFTVQIASALYTAVVNNRLAALGTSADLAVFAIINGYVIYVLQLIVDAFCYAMQAISSYNFGAKRWDRLTELLKKGTLIQTAFMAVLAVLICLFPGQVCGIFSLNDPALASAAADPTRIVVALCFLGYLGQLLSSYFECVGLIGRATLAGCALYLVFTVPLILILGETMGVAGVWAAQLVANVLTGALALVMGALELRRLRKLRKM